MLNRKLDTINLGIQIEYLRILREGKRDLEAPAEKKRLKITVLRGRGGGERGILYTYIEWMNREDDVSREREGNTAHSCGDDVAEMCAKELLEANQQQRGGGPLDLLLRSVLRLPADGGGKMDEAREEDDDDALLPWEMAAATTTMTPGKWFPTLQSNSSQLSPAPP
ncbi:unnamed protein product [Cuscuta campestris]|uniref:Uncharacterized protein n=1 Tax=Cuscuta campestris TaxID=132261 RepID=A0A484KTR9_9ASTE|nr:unnamed protein product [Cuscuta campestris]